MPNLLKYFQESAEELRKVTWPTRTQIVQLTFLVVGISLAVTVFIGAADWLFAWAYEKLITI